VLCGEVFPLHSNYIAGKQEKQRSLGAKALETDEYIFPSVFLQFQCTPLFTDE
jgi:hypothetical protein